MTYPSSAAATIATEPTEIKKHNAALNLEKPDFQKLGLGFADTSISIYLSLVVMRQRYGFPFFLYRTKPHKR
jgi:hypothetical protein